ncbi:YppE family protein [Bacillus manliponensis]|uniref:YppE family protein n=1 Tax=Bacillus manliponensis TaxID=574376 RepID=UPI0035186F79
MTYVKLVQITEQLIKYNDETIEMKQERQKDIDREVDFYKEIKPFVNKVDEALEEWKGLALDWIRSEKPKYIHLAQVEQVYDNLQNNALQCFAKRTNKKRFHETHQAILYTLQSVVNQCK